MDRWMHPIANVSAKMCRQFRCRGSLPSSQDQFENVAHQLASSNVSLPGVTEGLGRPTPNPS